MSGEPVKSSKCGCPFDHTILGLIATMPLAMPPKPRKQNDMQTIDGLRRKLQETGDARARAIEQATTYKERLMKKSKLFD